MVRTGLKIAGGLIGLYLIVYYWTGASKDATAGGNAGANLVRAFEGR